MLSPKPFASGGEGRLYKIIAPRSFANSVVKIYYPNKLTPSKEAKINYLLEYPPKGTDKTSIVWVQDSVRDTEGNFIGFIMPLVEGEKLEILCTPKLPKKLANTWYRFHNDAKDALDLRLKVCYNLAAAIHQIHASKRYVLVDLKPDNVIITLDGLVSLVDLDSVEVVENGQKLFDAPVATPEYTPPEYYKKDNPHDPTQQQAWDRFSMAVIFYKLLMGIHPFAGSFKKPYDTATTLAQKIEQHLFVHNRNISTYKKSIPPPHQTFYGLSDNVQDLFLKSFVDGSTHPQLRPTAHAWCSAIMQHLDTHRFRILPSKLVELPKNQALLSSIYKTSPSPSSFLQALEDRVIANTSNTPPVVKEANLKLFSSFRKINIAILVMGFAYGFSNIFFNDNPSIGYLTLFLTFISSFSIFIFTFLNRQNNRKAYLLKFALSETLTFSQKQEQIFKGIKQHLQEFWKQLNHEHIKLFLNTNKNQNNNIREAIQEEFTRLEKDLERQDKTAKDLIQSEIFEYTTLKEKYNRALHTHPDFKTASSLDAELSAIDFALQEKMEDLQKALGRELKSTQLEYDQIFEQDQRVLRNLERSVQQKIGQYRKKNLKAKEKEKEKTLITMKRQIKKELANVPSNISTRITLFKDEIEALLNKHNIVDIHQIVDIKTPGIITLEDGQRFSIAPLKYYQIHELLEWWMSVKLGRLELTASLKEQIDKHYETLFTTYKKKLLADLKKAQDSTEKRRKSIQKEATAVFNQLRTQNEPQILILKEKYREQKDFLNQLFEERKVEEQEIHMRYEIKFDELLATAQTRADATNKFIQNLYQAHTINPKKIEAYKKNQAKYDLGLQRLKEEHQRLHTSRARYKKAKNQAKAYQEIDLLKHLQQLFFMVPIS